MWVPEAPASHSESGSQHQASFDVAGRRAHFHRMRVARKGHEHSEEDEPASLTVVTSDARLAERVQELGAAVVGSGTFRRRLDATDRSS